MKIPRKDRIVDGMIIDDEDSFTQDLEFGENTTVVAHYFDLEVDQEIDPTIISEAMTSGRFADMRDLESFANMRSLPNDDMENLRKGNSATDIYGLTLAEIANMTDEALAAAELTSGGQAGLYDEEDNTNECD